MYFSSAAISISALFSLQVGAADVNVLGLSTNKAVVQIDGGAPRTLTPGQKTPEGVTLISVGKGEATFNIEGKSRVLQLGQQHLSRITSDAAKVTLSADSRGHFMVDGQVNGGAVRFVVDTGASVVALSHLDAQRLGINYRRGELTRMNTANGAANAWWVRLENVRVGAITINEVDAVVMENQSMPALLGMTFLNRVNMSREGQLLTLTKRF